MKGLLFPVTEPEWGHLSDGRISPGRAYKQAREQLVCESLSNRSLVDSFPRDEKLAVGFGMGLDERCGEYPWLLANLQAKAERMLHARSTLNHGVIVEHPLFVRKKLHIPTLAPEGNCLWHKGDPYLYDDVRYIAIDEDYYDSVACLSGLEHVGCDNALLTQNRAQREHRPEHFVRAMQEFRPVLRPGGTLLLTVPGGV